MQGQRNGYIAVTSALIISGIVFVLIFALGTTSYFGRFNILHSRLKAQSRALAESCVQIALLKFAEDDEYAGNETVAIDGNTCDILPLIVNGTQRTIQTKAEYKGTFTSLNVALDSDTFELLNWEEVASF
ncbi:MAG: hypothetical protein HY435_00310 [Candidatus Liptonbacteria bacterium]|nr:hypothetical protein [Candidatus Liptonbacteria bacterium]